jgi:hypothetical protein
VSDAEPMPKPRPRPTPVSQPFWDALRDERVALQRCDECDRWVYYPRARCPGCLSDQLTWTTVGVRVSTTLVDIDRDALAVGLPVEPVFDHGDDGITLLRFRPRA